MLDGSLRDEVDDPYGADLAQAMDAPDPLLEDRGIPRQVHIDYDRRSLKIESYAASIRREEETRQSGSSLKRWMIFLRSWLESPPWRKTNPKQFPAKFVLGLTATPYRKDHLEKILFHQCGPVRHKIKSADGGKLGKSVTILKTK